MEWPGGEESCVNFSKGKPMRREMLWGVLVPVALICCGEARAQVNMGQAQRGSPIGDFGRLPGGTTPPNPLTTFEFRGAFSPTGEALSLTFGFPEAQVNDTAYVMLLDPSPAVFIGDDDLGPTRSGVTWRLLDDGAVPSQRLTFEFDDASHFRPSETLFFTFWYRGRLGEGDRITLDEEFVIVPAPGAAGLGTLGLLAAARRRRRG